MTNIRNIFKTLTGKRKEQIIVILTFSFYIFAMLHRLTFSAFCGDEWVEYNISQMSTRNGDMYHEIINTYQPPMYNFLMHFWLRISTSMLWFRLFNVFGGLLAGFFLYKTVKRLTSFATASVSVIVLGCCYRWIYCIQDCSEYATMLIFLFASLFFYVKCKEHFTWTNMLGMLLSCVGAIYSQYGAVFIAGPLLAYFYLTGIFDRKLDRKTKIMINVVYAASAVGFALPLWMFFARYQTAAHHITENTVAFDLTWIRDVFFEIGKMTEWFFDLFRMGIDNILGFVITISMVCLSIWYIRKRGIKDTVSGMTVVLWFGYIIHYILTRAHIYALVQSGKSEGFYIRYSYFYIPLLCTLLPVLLYRLWTEESKMRLCLIFAGGICTLCMVVSFVSLMNNWHKTKDDIYAEIWLDNNGWEDTTFLLGMAKYGFNYYVSSSDKYTEGMLNNTIAWPQEGYEEIMPYTLLPLKFWVWRTEWNGGFWQLMVDMADDFGYDVKIYDDDSDTGQLAYCSYEGEPVRLNRDTVNFIIEQADFEDDGRLTIQSHIADCNMFNEQNYYKLTCRVYDKDRNPISQYNERVATGTWVTNANYYYSVDTVDLGDEYYVGMNMIGDGDDTILNEDVLIHIVDKNVTVE